MSVITSITATPNRLRIALKFVASCGPEGVVTDVLQQTLLPGALAKSQTDDETQGGSSIGSEVVNELRNLGLLTLSDGDSLKLSPEATDLSESRFVEPLREWLCSPGEAAKRGQRNFPRALAWFLCQDPASPLSWEDNYSGLVNEDCGHEEVPFDLTNRARCNQFVYWARFLGFAWRLSLDGRNTVIPDPTSAIAESLSSWKEITDWQPIEHVLHKLAVDLPVLEGGVARDDLESKLVMAKQRPEGHVSRSTSFALRRLERNRQVQLDRIADAKAMNLAFGAELRAISHLRWIGTSGDYA